MMNNVGEIFEELDRQDIHASVNGEMPATLDADIRTLCGIYRRAEPEFKKEMRSKVTRNATVALLSFVSSVATLATQKKDEGALDLGLLAFDLSDIMRIDFRDAFGHVAQLAFAATECGLRPEDRARAVIPDISARFLDMLSHSKPPKVVQDSEGKLVFWKPGRN
jgi:hypothetical protein